MLFQLEKTKPKTYGNLVCVNNKIKNNEEKYNRIVFLFIYHYEIFTFKLHC